VSRVRNIYRSLLTVFIHSEINRSKGRYSRESGNPEKHWIPGQARNDNLHKIYVIMYNIFNAMRYALCALHLLCIPELFHGIWTHLLQFIYHLGHRVCEEFSLTRTDPFEPDTIIRKTHLLKDAF
jgi:hypothetical protein